MDIFSHPLFIILAAFACVLLVHYLLTARRSRRRSPLLVRPVSMSPRPVPTSSSPPAPDLLLKACLGDRELAARLADYEKERAPGISDAVARQRALERIGRDNDRW
ncbi:hypothetical protein GO613_02345 [Azoarcus communis]|uniref:hypothetical protein n=1 Tax=Parazoarcus communis TaxID=41977 RepID=UPI0014596E8C|nr:hypothetical protein [Parazoarcus communis]NMG46943.1 hypothetical protein [Parazoarcus communis]